MLTSDDHERVEAFLNEEANVAGFIALHSTTLGPAMGGCRIASYPSAQAALHDALRLSEGMSLKNATADLPAGGGKAVIYRLGATPQEREAGLRAFGRVVARLSGRYVTAEDVGSSVADMAIVARETAHVAGLPTAAGRAGGDPSPWTALGVFEALRAALGGSVSGAHVTVQGLGSVGSRLCRLLVQSGARLTVADIDAEKTQRISSELGAKTAEVAEIHRIAADVFSPNALGGVLNAQSIPELGAPLVCGGANNQLARAEDGGLLASRGVLYVPDFVANAGGIINVVAEYLGESADGVEARVRAIGPRVSALLRAAREERTTPAWLAERNARDKIARVKAAA